MNEQIKSIKLKNYHLFFLQGLLNIPLSGKESRVILINVGRAKYINKIWSNRGVPLKSVM